MKGEAAISRHLASWLLQNPTAGRLSENWRKQATSVSLIQCFILIFPIEIAYLIIRQTHIVYDLSVG